MNSALRWSAYSAAYIPNKKRQPLKEVLYILVVLGVLFLTLIILRAAAQVQYTVAASQPAAVQAQSSVAPPIAGQTAAAYTPPEPDDTLRSLITEWIDAHPRQQWAVVVKGLNGNTESVNIQGGRQFETASIYKLLITHPLLEKVPLEKHASYYLNVNGRRQSLEACMDLMLRVSDNPCGETVADFVGRKYADQTLSAAGYTGTNLNRPVFMVTTANDTANILADIYEGRLLHPEARAKVLASLNRQRTNYGIPRGCTQCNAMNKTGEWNGNQHDAAIIEHDGGAYVIVVFSKGGSYTQLADLSRLVYEHMKEN